MFFIKTLIKFMLKKLIILVGKFGMDY